MRERQVFLAAAALFLFAPLSILALPLVLFQQADGKVFEETAMDMPMDIHDSFLGLLPGGAGCGGTAPSPFPVSLSPPVSAPLSSRFGLRPDPLGAGVRCHAGIDFAVPTGTPIAAAADGVVALAGVLGGYGRAVLVNHGNGVSTLYAHLSAPLVSPGQRVTRGQQIALSGNTGRSTGPHLHFEVRINGEPIDPLPLLTGGVPAYLRALHMVATAYSPGDGFTPGTITASGLPAGRGVVAVDPDVIPLGTRLYITGYGFAVAGDTGSAIKGYRIDLGMNTVEEARQWGRREVVVYVLQ